MLLVGTEFPCMVLVQNLIASDQAGVEEDEVAVDDL